MSINSDISLFDYLIKQLKIKNKTIFKHICAHSIIENWMVQLL